MGNVYNRQRKFEKALGYYMLSLDINKEAYGEEHTKVASIYINIGNLYNSNSAYDDALRYHHQALNLLKVLGDRHPKVASCYQNIGGTYYLMGDYDRALEYYLQNLDILLDVFGRYHNEVALAYNDIGNVYFQNNENDEAIKYYGLAIEVYLELYGENAHHLAMIYNNIGYAYKMKGNYKSAIAYYQRSIHANSSTSKSEKIQNIPSNFNFTNDHLYLTTLINKLNILDELDPEYYLPTIINSIDFADQLIDSLRLSKKRLSDQLELGRYSTEIYELGILNHHEDSAFYYSEKNKSGSLQLAMAQTNAIHFSGIPSNIVQTHDQVKHDLTFYSELLRDEKIACPDCDSSKINSCQEKVFLLHERKDSLDLLLKEYPEYKKLTQNNFTATVSLLQKQYLTKHSETAIIEYFWGDSAMYVFAITDKSFQMKTIPFKEDFKSNFYGLLKFLGNGTNVFQNSKEFASKAHWAYRTLIAPIVDVVKDKDHWLIIPDGDLYKLPFGALVTTLPKKNGKDYSSLSYLAKENAISYHFSATLLMQEAVRKRIVAPKDFIGFAPVF